MALCLIWMYIPLVLFVSSGMPGMAQFGQQATFPGMRSWKFERR